MTPDGRTVTADLPPGVVGGCGPNLHRLVLTLHFQGQMTCERIVAVLTAAGLSISKRQVVRLLTARLDLFRAEEEAFLSDPVATIGTRGWTALEAIAAELGLDYAGIDCGIDADGRLVLFEANASMLAHLNDDPAMFAYKHRYVPRIFDAMGRMVEARLAAAADGRWRRRPAA